MGSKTAVFLILVVLVFVRVYRVVDLGYFMMDEERDAFLVRRMLVDRRPLLIGGSIPGGINVGPAFFYISAVPYYLSRLNPLGPAWAAGAIGLIGVIGVFWVGKELFDRRVGILAAVFASFSLVNIIYQRPWWPLTISQVVALVVYFALFKLCKGPALPRQGRALITWILVLTISLTIGVQSDPSTLSLIPLSIVWLWSHRKKTGFTRRYYLAAVCLFLLAHLSWVLFEFRHGFQSSKAVINLFGTVFKGQSLQGLSFLGGAVGVMKMTAATVYRLFIPTGPLDIIKQISPAEVFLNQRLSEIWWPGAIIMLLVIGSYVISSFVHGLLKGPALPRQGRALIGLHFFISFAGILTYTTLFPGYVHEWMWFFMFPGFFLMAADIVLIVFDKARPLVTKAGPLLILVWAIWQMSLFMKLDNVAGLAKKLAVVRAAQAEIAGRPYELRSEGEGVLRYGGWRYLFTLYGQEPVKSYMDYVYEGWVYQKSENNPQVVVTVVNSAGQVPQFTLEETQEETQNSI